MGSEEERDKGRSKKAGASDCRIHVSFPDSTKAKLEEIRRNTGKASLSEVFREALKFYTLAYEEHGKKSDFLIRTNNGDMERLRMFL